MSSSSLLPRLLVIDDLYGRSHFEGRNEERARLCGQYLLEDVTGDEEGKSSLKINQPVAQAVFYRGQKPHRSTIGDTVENDLEGVLHVVRDGWEYADRPRWSLVLLDLCFYTGRVTPESDSRTTGMPEGRDNDDSPDSYFGLRILEALHDRFPDLPVIILSSKSRNEVSLEFTSKGALGFLPRGDDSSPEVLEDYMWKHGLIPDESGQIVGKSKATLFMLRAARRAALNRRNILLRGERGTGKELLAGYINRQRGSRRQGQFVAVNSAVFTSEMFASELFGIEARTATQVEARRGLIEKAGGGDLFFDEIKDMPPQVQAAVLRVIEQREIIRVGARDPIKIDVRFLSATNTDLEAMAAIGGFRLDLLDRLREGGTIYLPPLRERKEDIAFLVNKFVRDAENDLAGAMRRDIDEDALRKICSYDWPGNIRELRECVFRAVSDYPDVEHLVPLHVRLPKSIGSDSEKRAPELAHQEMAQSNDALPKSYADIDELIREVEAFQFNAGKPSTLSGKLIKLREVFSELLARYLVAALEATSKPTPEKPEGEMLISPAIKLMKGDKKITTSQAADEIKRILRECPELTDPILKEVYNYVLSLRPTKPKSERINKKAS